jgi:integrase
MSKIDSHLIQKIKTSYERGVPLIDIATTFNISRQLVSKFARKYAWMKSTSKKFSSHIKVESDFRRQFEQDDREDQKTIESHFSEWQIVRKILQYAIDHKDEDKAILAQKYAETLALIQSSELHLRSYRTRGRLKPSRIHLPNSVNNTIQQIKKHPLSLITSNGIQRISIGELFNRYKDYSNHLAPSTIAHWQKAINDLISFLGHSEANLVDREIVIRWKDNLLAQGKAVKTIESAYLGAARACFNFGKENGLVADNPFSRIKLPKNVSIRRRPKGFTQDEARKILIAAWKLKRGSEKSHVFHLRKWGPWLCAYTGARIGEICQLRKEDIKYHDNIWCIHITPAAGSVKTKTDRIVPIHPQLINLGFLKFVNSQPDGCLFSHDLDPKGGRFRSKILTVWVRSLGIDDKDIFPNHAWRHRFKSLCRQYGIAIEYQNAITGHANDRSVSNSYGEFPISALYRELIKFPKIKLSTL